MVGLESYEVVIIGFRFTYVVQVLAEDVYANL